MAEILEIKLREQLREELAGTYSVSVNAAPARVPRPQYTVSIQFGSAPERVGQLVAAIFAQIDSLSRFGAGEKELAKIKESSIRSRETDLKENDFWLGQLAAADLSGENLGAHLDLQDLLGELTGDSVRQAAQKYLDPTRYVRVTLLPEDKAGGPVDRPQQDLF